MPFARLLPAQNRECRSQGGECRALEHCDFAVDAAGIAACEQRQGVAAARFAGDFRPLGKLERFKAELEARAKRRR